MNREQAYDEHIAPLMTTIIELCREHDIPLVASFQINDNRPDEEPFFCTTAVVPPDGAQVLKRCVATLRSPAVSVALTVTTQADGSKTVESVLVSKEPDT